MSFAYLLYSIIIALVLGWRQWGRAEYGMIVGGPLLIYVVRAGVDRIFEYRSDSTQQHLDRLYEQRDGTIEKLKAATKYNSTQQLLEKYGGEESTPTSSPKSAGRQKKTSTPRGKQKDRKEKQDGKTDTKQQQQQSPSPAWTCIPPPPTANIRPSPASSPEHLHFSSSTSNLLSRPPPPSAFPQPEPPEVFAPNAFTSSPHLPPASQYVAEQSSHHWYDRLLDVLLGEDETQPKNRLALLCSSCRLVNGQAPPGVRSPEELGRWRCFSCGAWNGDVGKSDDDSNKKTSSKEAQDVATPAREAQEEKEEGEEEDSYPQLESKPEA